MAVENRKYKRETCRACTNQSFCMVDIFSVFPLREYQLSLADMISEIVDVVVNREDNLPIKLCRFCSLRVQSAFKFKRKFEQVHQLFCQQLNKSVTETRLRRENGSNMQQASSEHCTAREDSLSLEEINEIFDDDEDVYTDDFVLDLTVDWSNVEYMPTEESQEESIVNIDMNEEDVFPSSASPIICIDDFGSDVVLDLSEEDIFPTSSYRKIVNSDLKKESIIESISKSIEKESTAIDSTKSTEEVDKSIEENNNEIEKTIYNEMESNKIGKRKSKRNIDSVIASKKLREEVDKSIEENNNEIDKTISNEKESNEIGKRKSKRNIDSVIASKKLREEVEENNNEFDTTISTEKKINEIVKRKSKRNIGRVIEKKKRTVQIDKSIEENNNESDETISDEKESNEIGMSKSKKNIVSSLNSRLLTENQGNKNKRKQRKQMNKQNVQRVDCDRWLSIRNSVASLRPFKCDLCPAVFKAMHHLTVHRYIHTGERPYICTLCPRTFRQPCHLKTHMNTHASK